MTAYNDGGASPPSASQTLTTHLSAPAAPTGITTTFKTDTELTVEWNDSTKVDDDVTYGVLFKISGAADWNVVLPTGNGGADHFIE